MKTTSITLFCLLLLTNLSFAKTIVISDLDDTVKATDIIDFNNKSSIAKTNAARKGDLQKAKSYKGLSLLLNKINGNKDAEFQYVTASNKKMYKADKWVKENGLPQGEYHQDNKLTNIAQNMAQDNKRVRKFKRDKIKALINKALAKNDQEETIELVFFGDTTQNDVEAYQDVIKDLNLKNNPKVKINVFIRDAAFKKINPIKKETVVNEGDFTYFFSAVDLVKHPYFAFIDDQTKKQINDYYDNSELLPEYLFSNMLHVIKKQTCGNRVDRKQCEAEVTQEYLVLRRQHSSHIDDSARKPKELIEEKEIDFSEMGETLPY